LAFAWWFLEIEIKFTQNSQNDGSISRKGENKIERFVGEKDKFIYFCNPLRIQKLKYIKP